MAPQVKVNGVSTELPVNPVYFKQMAIHEVVTIPEQKPDMEQLVSVSVEAEILAPKIIETPCIKSYEGQLLSGRKLILEVKLKQKITYVADEPTQSVHAAHFEKTARSVFVVVPKEHDGVPIERLLRQNKLIITPYIEDIYAEQVGKREIFKNITILIDVTFSC